MLPKEPKQLTTFAVDWSGAAKGARHRIWMAEAREGELIGLENGRTRAEVATVLIERRGIDRNLVVGFDFAFSFPLCT